MMRLCQDGMIQYCLDQPQQSPLRKHCDQEPHVKEYRDAQRRPTIAHSIQNAVYDISWPAMAKGNLDGGITPHGHCLPTGQSTNLTLLRCFHHLWLLPRDPDTSGTPFHFHLPSASSL